MANKKPYQVSFGQKNKKQAKKIKELKKLQAALALKMAEAELNNRP